LGTSDFSGVDLTMDGEGFALSCSNRSRMDFACSRPLSVLPAEGAGDGLRSAMLGPDGLPCESRSIDLGLAFPSSGVCLTIAGGDGRAGTTSFGGDGFAGDALVVCGGVRGVAACSRIRDNNWRRFSIIESTRADGVGRTGLAAGGVVALFRISASRRNTSLVLCCARDGGAGALTLGAVDGGNVVTRGVDCGFTMIGFEAAGGCRLDRAPMPNICLMEFDRLSWPRSV